MEQPLSHSDLHELTRIRRETSVPIMLDESLCSMSDAHNAIDKELSDIFNIRISKCGGLLASMQLALQAKAAGLHTQLGCQVGETGILSAAGRHFASVVDGFVAVEGSFDRFLVKEPLTKEDLTFGYKGLALPLSGPGLGIEIDETAIKRVTHHESTIVITPVSQ